MNIGQNEAFILFYYGNSSKYISMLPVPYCVSCLCLQLEGIN